MPRAIVPRPQMISRPSALRWLGFGLPSVQHYRAIAEIAFDLGVAATEERAAEALTRNISFDVANPFRRESTETSDQYVTELAKLASKVH